jgi:hypothetical protein
MRRRIPTAVLAIAIAAAAASAQERHDYATASARTYYERLLRVASRADTPGRPELIEARRVVSPSGAR